MRVNHPTDDLIDEWTEYFLEDWYEHSEYDEVREDVRYLVKNAVHTFGVAAMRQYIQMREFLEDYRM